MRRNEDKNESCGAWLVGLVLRKLGEPSLAAGRRSVAHSIEGRSDRRNRRNRKNRGNRGIRGNQRGETTKEQHSARSLRLPRSLALELLLSSLLLLMMV